MNTRGKGLLRAANPTNRGVPPMNKLGSIDIPLVFPPEDQVRNVTVRVVEGLPYGSIVGAAFLRQNGSMINFSDEGGFRPTPGSPWVPFVAAGKHQSGEGGAKTPGWHAAPAKKRAKSWQTAATTTETPDEDAAPWEHFCAIEPDSAEQEPPDIAPPCGTRASERKGCHRPRLEGARMRQDQRDRGDHPSDAN